MSEPPKAFVLSVYMINSNIPISENEYLFKQRNRFSITEKFHQDTFENISELEILMLICLCWRVCFGFVDRHQAPSLFKIHLVLPDSVCSLVEFERWASSGRQRSCVTNVS